MTTERTSPGREVPEGQSRKQILALECVRDYLRDRSNANELTYSQQIDQWLPENWENVEYSHAETDIVNIKATPEVHGKVTSIAGERVKPGEVLALFALDAAVDNGDFEQAVEFAEEIPELLWKLLAANEVEGNDD